jgi:hypothetical protein
MKIIEAFKNRKEVENLCKEKSACIPEYTKLLKAENQIEFENILLANFKWCVENDILECWLPPELPNCTKLDCRGCTGLTALPELPNCTKLDYWGCTGLTALPELPNCTKLDCWGCTGLSK